PTEVQRLAWPRIADGAHLLASAPTGSGKTLAAFLWALDRLLTRAWDSAGIRVVYVSPMRALNNDVCRNLLVPLGELRARFAAAGLDPPELAVQTRSGDTPADERRRMLRRPPEILVTTPESLNILLTARGSRALFDGLETVILDEVHAVAGSKRGAHLITAVERLALFSGEIQRIALSATVEPRQRIAEWVGGWELLSPAVGSEDPHYRRRPVEVVEAKGERRYELSVAYRAPGGPDADGERPSPWPAVVAEVKRALAANRSTLVFGNSRRTVEKLTRLVNEGEREPPAWAHHGSLSREVREVVEERLKRGELRAIVATSSLELGIDIGALDEVLLVTTPPSVASAIQRLGRAGHQVGGVSRGRFLPLHARDLLDAAVVARAVQEGEVEPLAPIAGALDVLAQVVVSMTAGETWDVPALLAALRCAEPYHGLTRDQLDDVLEMLDGRHRGRVVPELRALVSLDAVEGTVRARAGAERVLYRGGGTIPDRGYFHLRRAGTGAKIGELDEEFVWERKIGDAFTLGVQGWRIEEITHNDVLVSPAAGPAAMAPFWRADERDRGAFLSARIAAFLAEAETQLDDPSLRERLVNEGGLTTGAASALVDLLRAQRRATGALPHAGRIVAERIAEGTAGDGAEQLVLHTFWGGRVNRPLAVALQAAWRRRHGTHIEIIVDDDALAVTAPAGTRARELFALVEPAQLEALLREELGATGFLGARFREAAGTALQLPRQGFGRRTPLWFTRQRAKQLLDRVARLPEFPLVVEAWRTTLADAFDLPRLRELLGDVRAGRIAIHEAATREPSPFAADVAWQRVNTLMYEDDAPSGRGSAPPAGLLRELVHAGALRPRVPRAVADAFQRKAQRLWPGYAPAGSRELLDWLRERLVVPLAEWEELLAAATSAAGKEPAALLGEIAGKLAAVAPPGAGVPTFVAALEALPRIAAAAGWERTALGLVPLAPGTAAAALRRTFTRLAGAGSRSAPPGADPLADLLGDLLR
ncbi:MAG: associated domain protein, partial [Acidobacteria bacterium]|nr:associated domain protein [Acidobacteriota bacterium]